MQYVEARLEPHLGESVEAIFYVGDYQPPAPIERLVPDGSVNFIVELDGQSRAVVDNESHEPIHACSGSWFSGLHSTHLSFTAPAQTELVGVRFRPGGAAPFVVKELDELAGRVVPGHVAFDEDVNSLRDELIGIESADDKLRRLANWLTERHDQQRAPTKALVNAVELVVAEPTVARLGGLHDKVGLSAKQLVAQFRRYVGVTPKLFQRIMRFSALVGSVHAEKVIDWAQVSVECGFTDQAHLIREFAVFSGFRPAEFLRRDDDRINFFPDAPKSSGSS